MKFKAYILTLLFCLLKMAPTTAGPLDSGDKLTMELESVPLATVLNMISQQNDLNFVLPGKLSGKVSMRLVNVDIGIALDAILSSNGYSYYLQDNVIVVRDPQDVNSFHASELVSRLILLKYAQPITVKKALASRLSDKGKVVILDYQGEGNSHDGSYYQSNRIIVTDYVNAIESLVKLAESIDVPERNILIEARIIEITVDTDSRLGFLWPTRISTSVEGASGTTSGGSSTTTNNTGGDAGFFDFDNDKWNWGKLSIRQLNTVLDILEQDGNSRLISNPRVTTLENHQAVMKIQTVIPIQTINRFTEGSATSDIVTFQDEEIGLSLTVTPRINEEGTITLDVYPVIEDIIGFNGPQDNQKPITSSRSIRTRVTVKAGETVVLGGLLKESEIESVQRVPLLGHIPIIGKLLFTNKTKETKTTDLVIFITPTILP